MFGNTGKQIKTAVKEVFGIFKAIGNDIRQEVTLIKEFKDFKKSKTEPKPEDKK